METLDQESFLEKYKLQDLYREELIPWNVLQEIYDDYSKALVQEELQKAAEAVKVLLNSRLKGKCHSIGSRIKDPEHLIEKIIRKVCIEDNVKYVGICKDNYAEIIRDLIGVRILVFSKENWEDVHDEMCSIFPSEGETGTNEECRMVETPEAYIRYGDRDVFGNKIHTQYSNKGYRSQHYVIAHRNHYCEIQVRTMAEEVYGEFDHKVRYPYRRDNNFLLRYTITMAQIMSVADELVSTCLQMPARLWDECAKFYDGAVYVNWEQRNKAMEISGDASSKVSDLPKDARLIANNKILRQGGESV